MAGAAPSPTSTGTATPNAGDGSMPTLATATSSRRSPRSRTTLDVAHWQLQGRIGGRRVLIRIDQPTEKCVSLQYTDPDGGRAVCTNTEQADVHIEIDDRQWSVLGTGHAEVGLRGRAAP